MEQRRDRDKDRAAGFDLAMGCLFFRLLGCKGLGTAALTGGQLGKSKQLRVFFKLFKTLFPVPGSCQVQFLSLVLLRAFPWSQPHISFTVRSFKVRDVPQNIIPGLLSLASESWTSPNSSLPGSTPRLGISLQQTKPLTAKASLAASFSSASHSSGQVLPALCQLCCLPWHLQRDHFPAPSPFPISLPGGLTTPFLPWRSGGDSS